MKLDVQKIDMDILDELLGKCEGAMIEPFRKKKAVAVELEPEGEEEAETPQHDHSDLDLEALLEEYRD